MRHNFGDAERDENDAEARHVYILCVLCRITFSRYKLLAAANLRKFQLTLGFWRAKRLLTVQAERRIGSDMKRKRT